MSDQPQDATSIADLVKRAAESDDRAWEELHARYSGRLWVVIRSYRLSFHDCQDVAQTVWCNLSENLTRLRDPARVGAWLAVTAHNECRRQVRLRRRTHPYDPGGLDRPDHRSPEAVHLAAEGAAAVYGALRRLDHPDRLVALLRLEAPELGADEVAELAGVPVGELGRIRRRAFRRLRRLLSEWP
ncbi:RNA polymerase sigma factor (sigma-70 family) [Spinactinospora alkalitolerans]|uniref:RNA polymerase sigma factor (Sigma-70 family) n=1 Tax=Spinactinospora alkalitolerans TaxID=687207 RepID=A0A852TS82_9ACTN|nr:sigma-70 family RNA polymerase sigma factor [Spinactinospora alkalitolerans]NYE46461.1 RNA polymerase sigma factor (sigma-70 family) [Spinactinospora alkalitolerans]